MLRFFRINDPYRLVFIFIILILIRVAQGFFISGTSYYELKWLLLGEWLGNGSAMYSETYDYTAPLSTLIYWSLFLLFGKSTLAFKVLSSFLIIVQAGIFNSLLLKNKVYNENSYLPALLYVILATGVPDFMTLSPQLMSLTFVLFALQNVIRRIDNQVPDELFLSSGISIGIASMFYFPAAIFFLVFLISLILFSSAVLRRLALYLYGFLLVFLLSGLYYYLYGSFGLFFDKAIFRGFLIPARVSFQPLNIAVLSVPFIVLLILSMAKKIGSSRLTNFQQKVEQVLIVLFLGGLSTFFLSNEKAGHELLFIVPVVAYFWTYYFILLKRKLFKAIMPLILVFGSIAYSCYFYQNGMQRVLVNELSAEEKTLVIGERLEVYANSSVLSPYFNTSISNDLINEIDTYEGADRFYDLVSKINPTVILDDMELMSHLMHRFPFLAKDYVKSGENEYRKISN